MCGLPASLTVLGESIICAAFLGTVSVMAVQSCAELVLAGRSVRRRGLRSPVPSGDFTRYGALSLEPGQPAPPPPEGPGSSSPRAPGSIETWVFDEGIWPR